MIALVLSALLAFAPSQAPLKDVEKRKAAVSALETAFEKGAAADRIGAIERATPFVDSDVIAWVGKGLKENDKSVQTASIEALRYMPHRDALAALLGSLERDKKLLKDAELHAKLVKAIGQHQNPAAVEKLATAGTLDEPYQVIDARIFAIANVRTPRAVELLIGLMRNAGHDKVVAYLPAIRLGLMRLTGDDAGLSLDAWIAWWNDHKKGLVVSPTPKPLPKEMQLRWDYFWGNEVDVGRPKKRGDRGDDTGGKQ